MGHKKQQTNVQCQSYHVGNNTTLIRWYKRIASLTMCVTIPELIGTSGWNARLTLRESLTNKIIFSCFNIWWRHGICQWWVPLLLRVTHLSHCCYLNCHVRCHVHHDRHDHESPHGPAFLLTLFLSEAQWDGNVKFNWQNGKYLANNASTSL